MEPTDKPPGKLKHYDESFKRSAVDLLLSSGKTLKEIAAELGVSHWNLRDWKRRYAPKPATPARTAAELEARVLELQKELQRVKIQRDILKKTLGIISTPEDNDSNA
jgi:transposase